MLRHAMAIWIGYGSYGYIYLMWHLQGYAFGIFWTNGPLRLPPFELHGAPGNWQTEHVVLNLVLCNQTLQLETIRSIPVISIHWTEAEDDKISMFPIVSHLDKPSNVLSRRESLRKLLWAASLHMAPVTSETPRKWKGLASSKAPFRVQSVSWNRQNPSVTQVQHSCFIAQSATVSLTPTSNRQLGDRSRGILRPPLPAVSFLWVWYAGYSRPTICRISRRMQLSLHGKDPFANYCAFCVPWMSDSKWPGQDHQRSTNSGQLSVVAMSAKPRASIGTRLLMQLCMRLFIPWTNHTLLSD